MSETRVKIQSIVENQLPAFIADESPLLVDFLKQYYISQEYPGGTVDLVQNLDKYVKLEEIFKQTDSVLLSQNVSYTDTTITVSLTPDAEGKLQTGTAGFPDRYGILKIDDEIITYTNKTDSTFEGCVRGFSGVTSYSKLNNPEELVFSSSDAAPHTVTKNTGGLINGPVVHNLSKLFFIQFLNKLKKQFVPGFDERELTSELNQNLFIKQSKDFYTSKGTDKSFHILFAALYGETVDVIKPRDYLFKPSDAGWRRTKDLVVEKISGDPLDLLNNTLYQNPYPQYGITEAYASVTDVERIAIGATEYYKLSFDADYNKDLILDGTVYGDFSVHPKTLIITPVSVGSTIIDVDSTVGFAQSGELFVTYDTGSTGVVTYTSKSVTQFTGVTTITSGIGTEAPLRANVNAYGYSGISTDSPITVRIGSVLEEVVIPKNTYFFNKNDTARIKTLGISSVTVRRDHWVDNIANTYKISSFELKDVSNNTYNIITYNNHQLRAGDTAQLIRSDTVKTETEVIDVINETTFVIRGGGQLNSSYDYDIRKNLRKGNSTFYPWLDKINANIQNTYTNYDNDVLVASPSIPFYNNRTINPYNRKVYLNGEFNGTELDVIANDPNAPSDHGFYTGDRVYYAGYDIITSIPDGEGGTYNQRSESKFSGVDEGLYYVKRINNAKLSLAKSPANIANSDFISVSGIVTSNILQDYEFRNKIIESQNILREIKDPVNRSGNYTTEAGKTGILVNGVELLNNKSVETVFYGQIKYLDVAAQGSGYDIINPPSLDISDSTGVGATGICAIKGSLDRIDIVDSGFDYLDQPFITITGGNGKNAAAEVNMRSVEHDVIFDATDQGKSGDIYVGYGATSLIGFSTYHKFRDYERVVYKTENQAGVAGLTTDASYHVSVVNAQTIRLHQKESDAISGINTVYITGYGGGNQIIRSAKKKDIISDIIVTNSGEGYENKKRTCETSGISTALNLINIDSHGYQTGETLTYSTTGTTIEGLDTSTQYLVQKINDDSFKLASVGLGTTSKNEYLDSDQFIDLKSIGTGIHSFNYPSISVSITGNIGVSTLANQDFSAKIQPIFRGSIGSIYLTDKGSKYGSESIINYDRQPTFEFRSGKNAETIVIVNEGQIVEVLVTRGGSGYNTPPDLVIRGSGNFAKLTPIVENGQLTEVKVLNGGSGYTDTTTLEINAAGSTARLKANIQQWTVNLFQKYLEVVSPDDGFIAESTRKDYGLEYCHMYAPRQLRASLNVRLAGGFTLSGISDIPVSFQGEIKYGLSDLPQTGNTEQPSDYHSPIIGWAYDGNPIYGPYGYTTPEGGVAKALDSGYETVSKPNRPSTSNFAQGFFIEDFEFKNTGDLDEHNGRYGKTPDFPEGVYAYFATIDSSSTDTSGAFKGFFRPQYPYVIGTSFYSEPNTFNFNHKSNQRDYDLNNSKWFRNTLNYELEGTNSSYDFVFNPDKVRNQTINIEAASTGDIESVGILTGGKLYNVNDRILFDNSGTSGSNAAAKVKSLYGKNVVDVSTSTTSFSSVEFATLDGIGNVVGFTTAPHGFKNGELLTISGLNTSFAHIEGSYNLGIRTDNFITTLGIGTTGVTGLTTFFYTTGFLDFPYIRENDVLNVGLGTTAEQLKVLNVDEVGKRIRVRRHYDGTIGLGYSAGTILYENPRKFKVSTGFRTDYSYSVNRELYFNPNESVGVGTSAIAGLGSTAVFSMPGIGATQVFVPYQQIYLPNHGLKTGEKVTYSSHGGTALNVLSEGSKFALPESTNLYVSKFGRDFIGISTVKVGLGTTGTFVGVGSTTTQGPVFFRNFGTGDYHSFTTKRTVISGEIGQNIVTVSTASTHGLLLGDQVEFKAVPKNTETITVKYDDNNRRAIFKPLTWAAGDVDTQESTITLENHNLSTGDKVIYTATSPSSGLVNEKIYYVLYYTKDKIRLCASRYDLYLNVPDYVLITSTSAGTISLVNPELNVYRNKIIKFDLSDSSLSSSVGLTSYSAFNFNFYKDPEYRYKFTSTGDKRDFEVVKTGKIGVESDANVSIFLNDDVPTNLYYKLEPANLDLIEEVKKEIVIDTDVYNNNQINLIESKYSGTQTLVGIGTTTFTYNLESYPESSSYNTATSNLYYTTKSSAVYGAIATVDLISGGNKYEFIPGISTVTSTFGKDAILDAGSKTIGRVAKTKIENIGFDYPTDFTLKPSLNLPEILSIEPLTSFKKIGISSGGQDYLAAPDLVVLDGYTGKQVRDVILKYKIGDTQVKIIQNTYGMHNVFPSIIPIHNSNGIGINTLSYDSNTGIVTAGIATGFSDIFPIAVGDKILVENTSVGVGSTSRGFNSDMYDYTLFPVTAVDGNLGGLKGSVTWDMSDALNPGEFPGEFDTINSSFGRIIPQKFFPIFDIHLKVNDFFEGEKVTTPDSEGIVESWNNKVETLKVSTSSELKAGEILTGESSRTKGVIKEKIDFDSYVNLGAYSRVDKGWIYDTGILNNNVQRLPDNNYYQYFSYALKSKVPYQTWNDPVSSLNHTSGFLKFSDLVIETASEGASGIFAENSAIEVTADLMGEGNLHCVYTFDLASERTLQIGSRLVSNEIVLENRVLTDYFESIGNRVLIIDDFSGEFNHKPRSTQYSVVNEFKLSDYRTRKYFTYIRDTRYTQERQVMAVSLLHDGSNGFLNQYGRVETHPDLGSFDFKISGTNGQLTFYPVKYKLNNYDVTYVSHDLKSTVSGIGSTSLGGIVQINSHHTNIANGSSSATTIVGIASTYRSSKVLVEIGADDESYFEYDELNLINNGSTVDVVEYGQLSDNNLSPYGVGGLGTYYAYLEGSRIKIDFTPDSAVGVAHSVNALSVSIASSVSTATGVGTEEISAGLLDSWYTSIAASGSPGVSTIAEYHEDSHGAYYVVQIEDTTNKQYELVEVIAADDGDYNAFTEYGILRTNGSLGTIGANIDGSDRKHLTFTPNANIKCQVRVFQNVLSLVKTGVDATQIDFTNAQINSSYGTYEGTERSIKRTFDLTHDSLPIFQRFVDGSDTDIVSVASNTITVPDHFFVTGEEVSYSYAGSGTTQAIGIATTSITGFGSTDKLPTTAYVVKLNDKSLKFAGSAADALQNPAKILDITSVGIGTSHSFTSTNQNAKAIVAIDNWFQSPIVGGSVTTTLAKDAALLDTKLTFSGITSFFSGNLIQINTEIMKINTVGFGSTNVILVDRPWMGTGLEVHSAGDYVKTIEGNYNIRENKIHFVEAPYGPDPISTTTGNPDDRDWTGISTHSTFQGRTFMRSGKEDTAAETYSNNIVFDDISHDFTGIAKTFTLKKNGNNVTGFSTSNGIILINGVFQGPEGEQAEVEDYDMVESAGISSITFTGTASSVTYDVNNANVPTGGVIVSVGSTEGFGYQPLVAAGGTAVISAAGTVQSIAIGNSGSGYRLDVQPTVNVAIQTSSLYAANYTGIGTAQITTGSITGIAITNPHVFYAPKDIQNVGYNSVSGLATVTTRSAHGLQVGEQIKLSGIAFTCDYAGPISISTAAYTSTTGIMTVTTATAHGFNATGKSSVVIFTGLGMTCAIDAGVSTHYYPRGKDPAYNNSLAITNDGTAYTVTNASYAPTTGVLTLTVASHGFSNGDLVRIVGESLIFTCAKDSHATQHKYPRPSDPVNNRWLEVANKTTNTFTVNVTPSSNTSAHTFVSASADGLIKHNGTITVNVGVAGPGDQYTHTFKRASSNAIVAGGDYQHNFVSAGTSCLISGGNYSHTFVSVGVGSITVTGIGSIVPTNATYTPTTGNMVLTVGSGHTYTTSDTVGFNTGSLVFECSMDVGITSHAYPRPTDPVTGVNTSITAVSDDTITVNVGTSNSVFYTPSTATYDGSTGNLVLTVGSHTLRGSSTETITDAQYDPNTGIMTCYVGTAKSFTTGDRVKFATNSLTFSCAKDSYGSNHTYPRSSDYVSNKWLPITGVTTNTFEVNVLEEGIGRPSAYTGIHSFVSATSNGLTKAGESVRLLDNSITFRCGMDDYQTLHSYPRPSDPYSNTSISIGATSATTITLNVGISTLVYHNVSAATYDPTDGDLVLTLTGAGSTVHNMIKGTNVAIATESLTFTCARDAHATEHRYPRKPDPTYAGVPIQSVGTTTTFTVNVGTSTVPTFYQGGGSVQAAIIAPRADNESSTTVDSAAGGTPVVTVLDTKTFTVNTGVSTRTHFYARGGKVDKKVDVKFDDPLSYSNLPLVYSSESVQGIGTYATIDIVVGQGSSVIDFEIRNTGYGFGQGEILTVNMGGSAGIPTNPNKTFKEFQITIDETYTDSFSGWTIGDLQVLDDFDRLCNGSNKAFPLKLNDNFITIRAAKGSNIDVRALLFIFVNDVLQKPGEAYKFEGGSTVLFNEPLRSGDTTKILFYKGTGDVDVVFRDILETIKVGDGLTLYNESRDPYNQGYGLLQDERTVIGINTTDSVETNPYSGPGVTTDQALLRPLKWCRQTRDKIINGVRIGKDRIHYEPLIQPTAFLIQNVGVGSTCAWVQNAKPFFDPINENNTAKKTYTVEIVSQDSKVSASATATVSTAGTITSVNISSGGFGYSSAPTVTIASPVGLGTTPGDNQAYATATLSSGVVSAVTIGSTPGSGYTSTNPPTVLIGDPIPVRGKSTSVTYEGDFGIISGISTTSVGVASTGIVFDLFIPPDSELRDSNIVGVTTVSGIGTGYYFTVSNSTVGNGVTSLDAGSGTVGIGTTFLDNVYQVAAVSIGVTAAESKTGAGLTAVAKVTVSVANLEGLSGLGYSSFYGNFSWGKVLFGTRANAKAYNAYTGDGITGISTGGIVRRLYPLKWNNYS